MLRVGIKVVDEWQIVWGYVTWDDKSTCVDIWIYAPGFKTTCIDRRIPLREGAFFFVRRTLFPPQDKRNTHDKAEGLCITSERYIG